MPSNTSWFFHYFNVNQGGDAPSSSCELFPLFVLQTADCHDVNHHSWLPPSQIHLWDISTGVNPASCTTWLPYAQLIHLPAAPPGIQHNPASTHPLFNQNKAPALFSEGQWGISDKTQHWPCSAPIQIDGVPAVGWLLWKIPMLIIVESGLLGNGRGMPCRFGSVGSGFVDHSGLFEGKKGPS